MKFWITLLIVIALVVAVVWAMSDGDKNGNEENTPATTPTASPSNAVYLPYSPSPTPSSDGAGASSDVPVGNKPGNRAADFRLKDASGSEISLRDYLGINSITLIFNSPNRIIFQSSGREFILLDPDGIVYRLYGVVSMPYTVHVNSNGIIQ